MRIKILFAVFIVIALIISVMGIIGDDFLVRQIGHLVFFLVLVSFYCSKSHFQNFNFLMFFILAISALIVGCAMQGRKLDLLNLGLWLGAYIFLAREAIKFTEYKRGSIFTVFYFVAMILAYVYLLSSHILEIESRVSNDFELSIYIIYYFNVLLFAIAALVYYLNSFSRKSVFFIGFTLSFIFSDVLRDIEVFYFRDISVEIVGTLIRLAALLLVFLFFTTPEKKLRLTNLV